MDFDEKLRSVISDNLPHCEREDDTLTGRALEDLTNEVAKLIRERDELEKSSQKLRPCVDAKDHNFYMVHPPEGSWGYSYPMCKRCGGTRKELQVLSKSFEEQLQQVVKKIKRDV